MSSTSDRLAQSEGKSGLQGFSLVEVVVAIIVLALGALGMAGTTAFVVRQVTLADVNTERAAALQSAIEQVRSTPYGSVGPGSKTVGSFAVEWSVPDSTTQTKLVRVVTTGPGLSKDTGVALPTLTASVRDTFDMFVLRP